MTRPAAPRSLQWRLTLALFTAVLITAAFAAALAFFWALSDANEILDGTLIDTGALIASGRMSVPSQPAQLPGSEPENRVLVQPLGPAGHAQAGIGTVVVGLPDGLHTVTWAGRGWRVLVTSVAPGGRIAIAQPTEVRDEVAQHSALRTLVPLMLLVPALGLLVREVVRRTLRPVATLARHVDSHAMAPAARLPELPVPLEIEPFVQSIRRLLRELTEALEQQQRFVANAAHELRSPMAALELQAANLEAVISAGDGRLRLEQLQHGLARMHHLLEQLLSMARSGALSAELVPVRVSEVARAVVSEFVTSAQAKGIDLGVDRCDAGLCVRATPIDISTLLRNALENAIKYSPPRSIVTVSLERAGPDAVLSVEDQGPGISEPHLRRIFEPFYRVPGVREPGSGLGLAIIATIASRLGGHAALEPRAGGVGMRFEYRQRRVACARDSDP